MNPRMIRGCFATAVALVAIACASTSVSTTRYANVPDYPPSNPAQVRILRSEPAQPHQMLAEISMAAPAGNTAPAVQQVEEKLRTAAAALGADAVVLVVDPLQPATVASRTWWGRNARASTGQDVIAVAIKYR